MRLIKINLAGFKSFVDSTTIPLNSNLVAIVGPNGCGKSNIVDAIRWVIGESSAKCLRAELMADVIFNGSVNRKPLGQTSVELVFDNSSGKLGGEFAKYAEIALRRVVNREGESRYYVNGTHCRRKDIIDIFLGTGLGPRSYAIIEQGMISQLIEAKPEELRAHLEEVAGISKYKERRRETSQRMEHTEENLIRLNDVREELGKQLAHLQRQARAAERYQKLKQQQSLYKVQLAALNWREFSQKSNILQETIKKNEDELTINLSKQQDLQHEWQNSRDALAEASHNLQDIQNNHYELQADINSIEQSLNHHRERERQLRSDSQKLAHNQQTLQAQAKEDLKVKGEVTENIKAITPELEQLTTLFKVAKSELNIAEQHMLTWQQRWDEFNLKLATAKQQSKVAKTSIEHIEQRLQNLKIRNERIIKGEENCALSQLLKDVAGLIIEAKDSQAQIAHSQQELQQLTANIQKQRLEIKEASQQLDVLRSELTTNMGQHASLEALQQEALGKKDQITANWLQDKQLADKPRLAETIRVDKKWSLAVEAVLEHYLEALLVEDLESLSGQLGDAPKGKLCFMTTNTVKSKEIKANTLLQQIATPWSLAGLVDEIYLAETIAEANAMVVNLNAQQSVITPEGIWLSPQWIKICNAKSSQAGVLARGEDLRKLQLRISDLQMANDKGLKELEAKQILLTQLEQDRDRMQQQFHDLTQNHSKLQANLASQQAKLSKLQAEQTANHRELAANNEETNELTARLEAQYITLQEVDAKIMDYEKEQVELLALRDQYRDELNKLKAEVKLLEQRRNNHQFKLESLQQKLNFLQQSHERTTKQLHELDQREQELISAMAKIKELMDNKDELDVKIKEREQVAALLQLAKMQVAELNAKLQQYEINNKDLEKAIQELRARLEQLRLEIQALKIHQTSYEEKIIESGEKLSELLVSLTPDITFDYLEEQIANLARRIQKLGPINLAAIDEHNGLLERKQYLDKQNDDLMEALAILKDAISTIDQETKLRFKEIFVNVNENLQTIFPKIFGGGNACLELTTDELLESGVIVKAQPPGKRNSTIHLLSGGEKALTATALVFSLFQLNPAPFCILDEVDAPLDDANVGRFCQLVKEMAEKVQFLFISHNKLTIAMAEQLTGVTMREPGVSRLVAVDMEQALAMATS